MTSSSPASEPEASTPAVHQVRIVPANDDSAWKPTCSNCGPLGAVTLRSSALSIATKHRRDGMYGVRQPPKDPADFPRPEWWNEAHDMICGECRELVIETLRVLAREWQSHDLIDAAAWYEGTL